MEAESLARAVSSRFCSSRDGAEINLSSAQAHIGQNEAPMGACEAGEIQYFTKRNADMEHKGT